MVSNSKALGLPLIEFGFHLVSGGSDNHLMLVDLRPSHPDLTKASTACTEGANVTLNRTRFRVKPEVLSKPVESELEPCSYLRHAGG